MIAAHRYVETQRATASPERLLVMLLQRCARAMLDARRAIDDGKRADDHLQRAIDIVCELRRTLDHARAPDLCRALDDVYGFVTARLVAASAHQQRSALIEEAERVLLPIVDAFSKAVSETRSQP